VAAAAIRVTNEFTWRRRSCGRRAVGCGAAEAENGCAVACGGAEYANDAAVLERAAAGMVRSGAVGRSSGRRSDRERGKITERGGGERLDVRRGKT
jgi:hypothetical protein